MEYVEKLTKQLMKVPFLCEINDNFNLCSIAKLNAFTEPSVRRLIKTRGLDSVQRDIDMDTVNFSVNYLTALVEITILKECHLQNLLTDDVTEMNRRIRLVANITNYSVAFDLVENGVKRIPLLSNNVNFCFRPSSLDVIINRVSPIIMAMLQADRWTITNYIFELIKDNLIEPK